MSKVEFRQQLLEAIASGQGVPPKPTVKAMVADFGKTIGRSVRRLAKLKNPISSIAEAKYRKRVCNRCRLFNFETKRCTACGCFMRFKNWVAEGECRRGYWDWDLVSVLIAARNEKYLDRTVANIKAMAGGPVEIIVENDTVPEGRRVMLNRSAKKARGKYLYVIDAHCTLTPNWDVMLKAVITNRPDDLVYSRIVALDEDTWQPRGSGYELVVLENNLRPKWAGGSERAITESMAMTGCGWMIRAERYWQLGGHDATLYPFWGGGGAEWSLKIWLSGGRVMLRRDVECGHLFRGHKAREVAVPYGGLDDAKVKQTEAEIRRRTYSREWPLQTKSVDWLFDRFGDKRQPADPAVFEASEIIIQPTIDRPKKAIIYYSHNRLPPAVQRACIEQLKKAAGPIPIISVTHQPVDLGQNIVVHDWPRNHISIYRQIIKGILATDAETIFMAEHDVLYPQGYFDFELPRDDVFYYQVGGYRFTRRGYLRFNRAVMSQLVTHRDLLLENLRERLEYLNASGRTSMHTEPGQRDPINRWRQEKRPTEPGVLDIRHGQNHTGNRGGAGDTYLTQVPYWGDWQSWAERLELTGPK